MRKIIFAVLFTLSLSANAWETKTIKDSFSGKSSVSTTWWSSSHKGFHLGLDESYVYIWSSGVLIESISGVKVDGKYYELNSEGRAEAKWRSADLAGPSWSPELYEALRNAKKSVEVKVHSFLETSAVVKFTKKP